jgi:hypothetical protein
MLLQEPNLVPVQVLGDGLVADVMGGAGQQQHLMRPASSALDRRSVFTGNTSAGMPDTLPRQSDLDARSHDDGAFAGKPEVFGGVGGDP